MKTPLWSYPLGILLGVVFGLLFYAVLRPSAVMSAPATNVCDWMYQKAEQYAHEAEAANARIGNEFGWSTNHRAEMANVWSNMYLACKERVK